MGDPLANIDLKVFQKYLKSQGLKKIRTKGGHEIWSRKDLLRPVIIQSHLKNIPSFIVRNNLRIIGVTAADFKKWLKAQK